MTSQIPPQFSRLVELDIRNAWRLESHEFTPWLSTNLDYLSDAIGIPLELIQREAPVGPFWADLLLRNAGDDSLVLVENQLEISDHTHLGQILTYLQGLEAKTVVWIAPRFKDEHLSAIRWLNDNTLTDFAFFAVRIKAVRIENSPIAPVFEVLERPNEWERTVHRAAQAEISEQGVLRQEFWTYYLDKYPAEKNLGSANASYTRWHTLRHCGLIVGQYVAPMRQGVYVRGLRGALSQDVFDKLSQHRTELEESTGIRLQPHSEGRFLILDRMDDLADRTKWDELSQWLFENTVKYEQVLDKLFGDNKLKFDQN